MSVSFSVLFLFGLSSIRVENWVLARTESQVFSLSGFNRQINSLCNFGAPRECVYGHILELLHIFLVWTSFGHILDTFVVTF